MNNTTLPTITFLYYSQSQLTRTLYAFFNFRHARLRRHVQIPHTCNTNFGERSRELALLNRSRHIQIVPHVHVEEGDIYLEKKIKFSSITYCCYEFALKTVSFKKNLYSRKVVHTICSWFTN